MIKRQEIKTKVMEDNIIHVSIIMDSDNGKKYERIYYLDFNKLTNTEHQISFDHDHWMTPPKERTKVRLTFEDIPVSKIMEWNNEEEDDPL